MPSHGLSGVVARGARDGAVGVGLVGDGLGAAQVGERAPYVVVGRVGGSPLSRCSRTPARTSARSPGVDAVQQQLEVAQPGVGQAGGWCVRS